MSDFVCAHELNDDAFELARLRFVREEAQSWVQAQMRPVEHAVAAVCAMLGLKLDAETLHIAFDPAGFEQQVAEVQGAEPDQYKAVLENRLQLLSSPSEQTLQRYFPENYEHDVIEVARVLQGLDHSALGEESLQTLARLYEQYLQTTRSDYLQQTESPRWFIELSNDWDITYHPDGSVAEDPQLD